jgi:hypothetical protein
VNGELTAEEFAHEKDKINAGIESAEQDIRDTALHTDTQDASCASASVSSVLDKTLNSPNTNLFNHLEGIVSGQVKFGVPDGI